MTSVSSRDPRILPEKGLTPFSHASAFWEAHVCNRISMHRLWGLFSRKWTRKRFLSQPGRAPVNGAVSRRAVMGLLAFLANFC